MMDDRLRLAALDERYPVTAAHREQYQRDGFIRLKDVFSADVLRSYAGAISREVDRLAAPKPMHARTTYERAFVQIMNLWRNDARIAELVRSRRLARIASELMGVGGVRLYHDQALFKEPGGGHTPWHADQQYWPLDRDTTCTAWIPLQPVPMQMGPLEFAVGSHRCAFGRDLEISDDSERLLARSLKDLPCDAQAFDLGEVSFHSGWTFHRARGNETNDMRAVMTVIYFEDGTRLKPPENSNQRNDWERWMPGARVGEIVATELNPLLWSSWTPGTPAR